MFKKYQSVILIILFIVAAWFVLTSRQNTSPTTALGKNPLLFYTTTCPHCKNVRDFLTKNDVQKKIKIEELEVSEDQSNIRKYEKAVEICRAPTDKTGSVPLLFADGNCYFGEVDVINYFKNRIK